MYNGPILNHITETNMSEKTASTPSGLKSEAEVIRFFGLDKGTRVEDLCFDIDAWDDVTTISIKTQHTALRTGNIALETHLINRKGKMNDSWFYTGLSDKYWIRIGNTVYVYDTDKLKKWVLKHEHRLRVTKLTDPDRIQENISQGRKSLQSRCLLVPMRNIEHLVERELYLC